MAAHEQVLARAFAHCTLHKYSVQYTFTTDASVQDTDYLQEEFRIFLGNMRVHIVMGTCRCQVASRERQGEREGGRSEI